MCDTNTTPTRAMTNGKIIKLSENRNNSQRNVCQYANNNHKWNEQSKWVRRMDRFAWHLRQFVAQTKGLCGLFVCFWNSIEHCFRRRLAETRTMQHRFAFTSTNKAIVEFFSVASSMQIHLFFQRRLEILVVNRHKCYPPVCAWILNNYRMDEIRKNRTHICLLFVYVRFRDCFKCCCAVRSPKSKQ